MRPTKHLRLALAALLAVSAVHAEEQAAPGEASAAPEPKRVDWDLSGEIRLRGEYRDDLDLNSAVDDEQRFWLSRIRLGFEVILDQEWGLFVQAQDSRRFGEEASTASNEQNLDLHQGYADLWKHRTWSLRVGRQEFIYGEERLIGAFDWDNVGRSFDGARIRFQRPGYRVDGLLAALQNLPTTTGGTTGSQLYGVYAQNPAERQAHWEGYWLEFADHVAAPGENGVPGTTRVDALGGRVTHVTGRWDGSLEAVWETGDFRGDDLDALAAALQVGHTWGDGLKTRLFGGYDFATGDRDDSDGEQEEFFNFFPTNHKFYGYMDLFGWRNIRSYYGGVRFSWDKQWAQAKFHQLSLQTPGGPWKNAGGAVLGFDPTGQSGRSVGWEIDLNYNWAFRKKSGLQAGASVFEPERFADATRGSDAQTWAYLMLTLGF
jgi:hypothetical protein